MFEYFAGPRDTNPQTYPGLNNGTEGNAILAAGCEVPRPPTDQPEPTGTISGECIEDDETDDFVVTGTLDYDESVNVAFRLFLSTGETTHEVGARDLSVEKAVSRPVPLGSGRSSCTP